jgi:urease accessory protein
VTAGSPLALMRAVYHLANRHVAAQLAADHVLIERDPVLASMLVGLGAQVELVEAPFAPESGAYAGGHGHGHGHGHAHCDEIDEVSATVGEQLSIAAHARRAG